MGISNTLATVPGIIANVLAGKVLKATRDWRPVFGLSVVVLFGGLVAFMLLAKGSVVLVPPPKNDRELCRGQRAEMKWKRTLDEEEEEEEE